MERVERSKTTFFPSFEWRNIFFGGIFGGYRGKVGCAIVTTEAIDSLKPIHERMPLIVSKSHFKNWLNGDEVDCMDSNVSKQIVKHRVSRHVNNPINNDPKCVFPTKEKEGPGEDLFS